MIRDGRERVGSVAWQGGQEVGLCVENENGSVCWRVEDEEVEKCQRKEGEEEVEGEELEEMAEKVEDE